jgi:hypothetical protein
VKGHRVLRNNLLALFHQQKIKSVLLCDDVVDMEAVVVTKNIQ